MLEAETTSESWAVAARIGGALIVVSAFALPAARAVARRIVPEPDACSARWGILHALAVLWVGLCATIAVAFLWPAPDGGEVPPLELLLRSQFVLLAAGAAIAAVAAIPGAGGAAALGLRWRGSARASAMGVAVYLLLLPAVVGVGLAWPWVLERIGGQPEAQRVMVAFVELEGWRLAVAVLLGVTVQPFLEELIFRGFLQPVLVRSLRAPLGVGVTSALFALMHGWTASVPIFALSLIFGFVMLRTQRLVAAWGIHALHNGLMLTLQFYGPETLRQIPDGGLLLHPFA